jgi:hypothetical protein
MKLKKINKNKVLDKILKEPMKIMNKIKMLVLKKMKIVKNKKTKLKINKQKIRIATITWKLKKMNNKLKDKHKLIRLNKKIKSLK